MKILLIGQNQKSLDWVSMILQKRKIFSVGVLIRDLDSFISNQAADVEETFQAIVIDRVTVDEKVFNYFKGYPCFFIYKSPKDFEQFHYRLRNIGECRIRFYFWPLNIFLLTDDLLSIAGSRNYQKDQKIIINAMEINYLNRSVCYKNKVLFMKNKEFDLLFYLAKNRGKVLSRTIILEEVWDMNSRVLTNTVDVHVSKIRRTIRYTFGINSLIKTIPCSGYLIP